VTPQESRAERARNRSQAAAPAKESIKETIKEKPAESRLSLKDQLARKKELLKQKMSLS